MSGINKVVVVGPFPPPVHGMAKNTLNFYNDISSLVPTEKIDISPGVINRGWFYHFSKLKKVISGLLAFFKVLRSSKRVKLYTCPDAGLGSYYTLLFSILAVIFKAEVILHHRSFAYIKNKKVGAYLIKFVTKNCATHIFLCDKMRLGYVNNYGSLNDFLVVSNAQYVTAVKSTKKTHDEIIIGHLSNLGFGKGLREVFEVLERLIERGVNVKLYLGGEPESGLVKKYLDQKLAILSDKINYYGLVSGDKKADFYSKIDFFIFPSSYKNEAQPNVIFEANSYGVPVYAVNVGCVEKDIDYRNGFVYESQSCFVDSCVSSILKLKAEDVDKLKSTTLEKTTFESEKARGNYSNLIVLVSSF